MMWALIGGSGFEKFDGFEVIERLDTATPFGEASSGLCRAKLGDQEFVFLSRHGSKHELLPSQINFKANIFCLKKYGAKAILSISAVGSLKEELPPGHLVVPDQYIDRTKRQLSQTSFLGDKNLGSLVGHLSMGDPVDLEIFPVIKDILEKEKYKEFSLKKTYICMEGPNFSTRAESKMYQTWGADIIGMTNFPEYSLAKEANLLYIPFCYVTDYDSWRKEETPVTLDEIIAIMKSNNLKAFSLISKVITNTELSSVTENYKPGLPNGLMSSVDHLNESQMQNLKVLS